MTMSERSEGRSEVERTARTTLNKAFNGLDFRQVTAKEGLTMWVCMKDNVIIAQAWSLLGVRSQVLQLLRHNNWRLQ